MTDIIRIDQNARRSRAVVHGGLVFLAGQVADDKTAPIAEQTRQVLAKVDDMLARAGTDKSRLLSAQIWLRTMDDFEGMNAIWDAWVVPGQTPTRCCGKVELADPAYRVEIVVTAALWAAMAPAADTAAAPFRRAQRIAGIQVSEILRIAAVATQRRKAGRPMIVLAAGEPDFDTPDHVKEAAIRAIREGQTKYTVLDGTAELKAAIRAKFRCENRLDYAEDEISVGAGAKQVMHNALMATLDPGDEVILAAPYWTSYADMVLIAGGRSVPVSCAEENGFRLNAADLEAAITPRTRWLLLNSPSNPSGAAYRADQLQPLLDVLKRHPQVWLMSDDIYEHLLYDGVPFATGAELEPALKERTLTVNGVSKSYAMTGWRVGYGGGPKALIAAMAVVQSQSTSNPCSISQAAALAALSGPQDTVAKWRQAFQRRRDLVVERLNAIEGITCRRPEGAFYAFASCTGLIGRRTPDGTLIDSDTAFCRYLLDAHDLAVVPGSCFGLALYFRVSYATSEAILREACERMARTCKALQ